MSRMIITSLLLQVGLTLHIKSHIILESKIHGIDPSIALAIARHESGFNPNKIGGLGEIGLFQLRPEFHPTSKNDWQMQISDGIRVLKKYKRICEPKLKKYWYICFNVGPTRALSLKHIGSGPYAKKVMEYAREEQQYKRKDAVYTSRDLSRN